MSRTHALLAAAALLAAVSAPARAEEIDPPDLKDVAAIEALVRRVEVDGFKRFPAGALAVKPEGLRFDPDKASLEQDRAFYASWVKAYRAALGALVEHYSEKAAEEKILKSQELEKPVEKRVGPLLKEAQKQRKKSPLAAEIADLVGAVAPRYAEVLQAKDALPDAVLAAREKDVAKFLKRYDFGPKIATAAAVGTAVIEVKLAPDTFELVRRTMYGWKFTPLLDPQGAPVTLKDKRRVEFTGQVTQGEVREALRQVPGEFFVVRYAKMEKEKTVDLIRVTGAKLAYGTYYIIEHEDRLVVSREPAPR